MLEPTPLSPTSSGPAPVGAQAGRSSHRRRPGPGAASPAGQGQLLPLLLGLLSLLGGLGGLVLVPGSAAAGGFSNLDFGQRRNGMFAVTARPDDGAAIFHNPAGLTLLDGTQLYHSQTWALIDMGLRMYDSEGKLHPDHEVTPDWNIGILPFFTVSSDLGGMENLRLAFGIYAPNAYGAALPDDEPTRYHATQVLFIASRATAAAAYRFSDQLSLGVGLSLIHVYLTAERTMSPLVLADPDRRFDDPEDAKATDATLEMNGQDLTFGADVGILLTPRPNLRLGASFSKGAPVELEGDVKLTWANGDELKTTHATTMVIPFNLRAGFNWEFAPAFELGMDIYWWNYQVLQEQRTQLGKPIMGMSELVDAKNYHSSWNWCIGILHRVTPDFELMMGYQEDKSPIPKTSFSLENPTQNLKGVSLGIRWQLTPDFRFGLGMVRNWYDLIDIQVSQGMPPSNVKGHGGNTEFSFDLTYKL